MEPDRKNWRVFSKANPLDLEVDLDERETYLIKLPCSGSIHFKLFLYGDGEQNLHVELFNANSGKIYCNKAGPSGESSDFGTYGSWECEENGENMLLE